MLGALLKALGIMEVKDMSEVIAGRFGGKLGFKNFKVLGWIFQETQVA